MRRPRESWAINRTSRGAPPPLAHPSTASQSRWDGGHQGRGNRRFLVLSPSRETRREASRLCAKVHAQRPADRVADAGRPAVHADGGGARSRRDGMTNFRQAAIDHAAQIMEVTGTQWSLNGYHALYVHGFVKK